MGTWILSRVEFAEPSTALILIAAAFPLGFLISVVANEIAWALIRIYPETRVRGRIATARVVELVNRGGPYQRWLQAICADMNLASANWQRQREAHEAIVELVQRTAKRGVAYREAVARVRSLADVMNSLLNTWTAVAFAASIYTIVYVLTICCDQSAADYFSLLAWMAGVALILAAGVWIAGKRCRCVQDRAMEVGSVTLLAWTLLCVGSVVLCQDSGQDLSRLVIFLTFQGIVFALLWCLSMAERRVASITEVFVVGMIRGGWPGDD